MSLYNYTMYKDHDITWSSSVQGNTDTLCCFTYLLIIHQISPTYD